MSQVAKHKSIGYRPAPAVTSHVTLNGWQFTRRVKVCNGLVQTYFTHPVTGHTAREQHRGAKNTFMGLVLSDASGKQYGTVASVKDLP